MALRILPYKTHELISRKIAFGTMSDHPLLAFSEEEYNHLRGPELVYKNLCMPKKKVQFEALLQQIKDLQERYPDFPWDQLGFRLLHRHGSLKSQEVMVEKLEETSDLKEPLYITRRVHRAAGHVPASWMLNSDNNIMAFEFSEGDLRVRDVYNQLCEKTEGLIGIFKQIREHGLEKELGVGTVVRDRQEELKSADGVIDLVETTSLNPFASTLRRKNMTQDTGIATIPTIWAFGKPRQHGCVSKVVCVQPHPEHIHVRERIHDDDPCNVS